MECVTADWAVRWSVWMPTAGIGSGRAGLHPVQERLSRAHGSQCGFCTPGAVTDPPPVPDRTEAQAATAQLSRASPAQTLPKSVQTPLPD